MRTVPFELEGQTCWLLLNGAALFDIYDRFGTDGSVFDPIKGNDREAFDNICWYLEELSTQGELFRRRQGMDRGRMLQAGVLKTVLSPLDVTRARKALQEAIFSGFFRDEVEPPREIDKGLLELEKKTGGGSPVPST